METKRLTTLTKEWYEQEVLKTNDLKEILNDIEVFVIENHLTNVNKYQARSIVKYLYAVNLRNKAKLDGLQKAIQEAELSGNTEEADRIRKLMESLNGIQM
jgi:hypothetical protein